MRRRTYRAHGRINRKYSILISVDVFLRPYILFSLLAYMSSPAHIELCAEERPAEISKAKEASKGKVSRKRLAQSKAVKVGGGVDA